MDLEFQSFRFATQQRIVLLFNWRENKYKKLLTKWYSSYRLVLLNGLIWYDVS